MISTTYLVLLAASIFLALVASWSVVSPFFSNLESENDNDDVLFANLSEEKEALLQSLEELEVDYKSQKITDGDYQKAKAELSSKAAECFRALDRLEKTGS